jgi:hypothetical protein
MYGALDVNTGTVSSELIKAMVRVGKEKGGGRAISVPWRYCVLYYNFTLPALVLKAELYSHVMTMTSNT